MKLINSVVFMFCSFLLLAQNQSSLVFTGENGKLEYTKYANTGQIEVINQIPDFSWAGFKSGGVKLPEVPVVLAIEAVEGDNLANIQQAIDKVSSMPTDSNGFRGAILFKAGLYECSTPIKINTSGVVPVTAENGITKKVYSVQFTYPTGISDISDALVRVYPNPVSSLLNIHFKNHPGNKTYAVSSIDGKILITGKCNYVIQQIDWGDLNSGMYFLHLEGERAGIKFIKQ